MVFLLAACSDYCLPGESDAPPARQLSFTVTVR